MASSRLMKCGEFAKLCKTTKDTLIHYDRTGVFRPSARTDAGHRLYSLDDYYRFCAVRALACSGVSLNDAAELLNRCDTSSFVDVARQTEAMLEAEMGHLRERLSLIRDLKAQAEELIENGERRKWVSFERERRMVLYWTKPFGTSDFFDPDMVSAELSVLSILADTSAQAAISPYGCVARRGSSADDPHRYDASAFFLSPEADPPCGFEVEVMPEGEYAHVLCDRPVTRWDEVRRTLTEYVESIGRFAVGDVYVISGFSLFENVNEGDLSSCVMQVRID